MYAVRGTDLRIPFLYADLLYEFDTLRVVMNVFESSKYALFKFEVYVFSSYLF